MTKVVLYSGGLDSFCLADAVQPDLLLYFDTGLPEQQREITALRNQEKADILAAPLTIDTRFHLAPHKLANEVMPFRNLYFLAGAFSYGDTLYLGKTASSQNLDKNASFASMALQVLRYVSQNRDKNPPGLVAENMTINLPFDEKTKSMFVGEYLTKDPRRQQKRLAALLQTRSCYAPGTLECGVCQSCIRKSIALVNNNIDITALFSTDPTVHYFRQFVQYSAVRSVTSGLVREEISLALRNTGQI